MDERQVEDWRGNVLEVAYGDACVVILNGRGSDLIFTSAQAKRLAELLARHADDPQEDA